MIPPKQRTLKGEVTIQGIGTHSGEKSLIRLLPAKPNTGIHFVSSRGIIAADLFNLDGSNSNTSLKNNGFYIETVEHLLSCLYGMFIDNVEIDVFGVELPIGDGSAKVFYDAIREVGIEEQSSNRTYLQITNPIYISNGDSSIGITPCDKFIVHYYIDWHPKIVGEYTFVHEDDNYSKIAEARTFADRSRVMALQRRGRALGSKFGENVIDLENGSTRMQNEFVKHKILDLVGDLSLLYGYYILGEVNAVNAGHKLHHDLMKGIANV